MSTAFAFLGWFATIYMGWNLLTSLFVPSRRTSKLKRAGIAFLVLTASILIGGILFENDARNEGSESVNDRQEANSVGIYDPAVWKAEKEGRRRPSAISTSTVTRLPISSSGLPLHVWHERRALSRKVDLPLPRPTSSPVGAGRHPTVT
ncbi:hypothetical protein ACU8OH_14950 [Rhizobium leguminosarum]